MWCVYPNIIVLQNYWLHGVSYISPKVFNCLYLLCLTQNLQSSWLQGSQVMYSYTCLESHIIIKHFLQTIVFWIFLIVAKYTADVPWSAFFFNGSTWISSVTVYWKVIFLFLIMFQKMFTTFVLLLLAFIYDFA